MLLVTCLMLGIPAWAGVVLPGVLQFFGNNPAGQGLLSFTPGPGDMLTIGAGNGANGGLITDLFNGVGLCGGDCAIHGGYLTLTSGPQTSGVVGGGLAFYTFGAGGIVAVFGTIPSLGINNGLLFAADFAPNEAFSVVGTTGTFSGSLDVASIFLNPQLGAYNYVSGSTVETSLSLSLTCASGGICQGPVDPVLQVQTAVPEPGTLGLFGAGLVTFGARLRKRNPRA